MKVEAQPAFVGRQASGSLYFEAECFKDLIKEYSAVFFDNYFIKDCIFETQS